tara:strand:- start:29 stop:706 length:678 start_codon:yes stop_codon:yes gene_type:complete
MRNINGWYLPETDTSFDRYLTEDGYQCRQRNEVLQCVTKYKGYDLLNAVDVGGHVGFWAKDMCNKFEHVYVFEPMSRVHDCFYKNMEGINNYDLIKEGLGDSNKDVTIKYDPSSTGNTFIDEQNKAPGEYDTYTISVNTLDSHQLKNIDYIKIDAEGYEKEVIEGSRNLIYQCKPVLHCEVKSKVLAKSGKSEISLLQTIYEIGYVETHRVGSERVFVHRNDYTK